MLSLENSSLESQSGTSKVFVLQITLCNRLNRSKISGKFLENFLANWTSTERATFRKMLFRFSSDALQMLFATHPDIV